MLIVIFFFFCWLQLQSAIPRLNEPLTLKAASIRKYFEWEAKADLLPFPLIERKFCKVAIELAGKTLQVCNLSSKDSEKIRILRLVSGISHLTLKNCDLQSKQIALLNECFEHWKELKSITLNGCKIETGSIDSKGIVRLNVVEGDAFLIKGLKEILLQSISNGNQIIMETLKLNASSLEKIVLKDCLVKEQSKYVSLDNFVHSLEGMERLSEISLDGTVFIGRETRLSVKFPASLHTLNIPQSNWYCDGQLDSLLSRISSNVKALSLNAEFMKASDWQRIMEFEDLKSLVLYNLDAEDESSLCKILERIEELSLISSKINAKIHPECSFNLRKIKLVDSHSFANWILPRNTGLLSLEATYTNELLIEGTVINLSLIFSSIKDFESFKVKWNQSKHAHVRNLTLAGEIGTLESLNLNQLDSLAVEGGRELDFEIVKLLKSKTAQLKALKVGRVSEEMLQASRTSGIPIN